jgi:hypothetical protein
MWPTLVVASKTTTAGGRRDGAKSSHQPDDPAPHQTERTTDMTLEKLLIFGFALAALFAITTVGVNMMTDRGDQNEQYETAVSDLTDSSF